MITAWGYEVDELPNLIDVDTFNDMTGNKHAGDSRVEYALNAASQAVRNACGWHISPSLECTAKLTANGHTVKLPANQVNGITSVKVQGATITDYDWSHLGLVVGKFTPKLDGVEIEYTAGYDEEAVPDLAMTVSGIVEGVLTVAPGVASESADGVSISYSSTASSVAASITSQQLAALAPYRLVSSHAA